MKNRYDVIVVGAGPGGSIAAKNAAEKGLDVLLIEKRQQIGDPVRCAEGVGKLTLRAHIKPDRRWISADVKGSHIYSPDGTMIEMSEIISGGEVGYVLERKLFDRALAQEAAKAGAEVQVKTRATSLIMEDGFVKGVRLMQHGDMFDIHSSIVIGADGVESKVGRWAGIDTTLKPNDIETCAQFLVIDETIDSDYCKFYLGSETAPAGYIWVFPKGNHMANVGIGILGSHSGANTRAITLLQAYIAKNMPNSNVVEMVVGGVPVAGPIKQSIANGLMLVGDAAWQSDPLTGGGIINAMDAGKIAAEVAYDAIQNGDVSEKGLADYEKRWRKTIGKEIGMSLRIKDKFTKLSNDDLNSLAHSLDGVNIDEMNIFKLLYMLFKKNQKLMWEFKDMFADMVFNSSQ